MKVIGDDPWGLDDIALCATNEYLKRHPTLSTYRADILSDARLGAYRASQSFDGARGIPWGYWGLARARSTVLDGVRDRAPLSRATFKKASAAGESYAWAMPLSLEGLAEDVGENNYENFIVCDRGNDPFIAVDNKLLLEQLWSVLTKHQKEAIYRVDICDEMPRAVAQDLGVTEGAISLRRSKGIKRMRAAALELAA